MPGVVVTVRQLVQTVVQRHQGVLIAVHHRVLKLVLMVVLQVVVMVVKVVVLIYVQHHVKTLATQLVWELVILLAQGLVQEHVTVALEHVQVLAMDAMVVQEVVPLAQEHVEVAAKVVVKQTVMVVALVQDYVILHVVQVVVHPVRRHVTLQVNLNYK